MSQSGGVFDFGNFFPGLDFFTGKGASAWLMPTVSEQELDKRIAELKTVLFWLEQNAAAIKAGIQALEVQKMTLATLQSMNVGAAELARAFAMPAAAAASAPPPPAATRAAPEAVKPEPAAAVNSAVPDPLQWWNALTQQFQSMAAATAATAATAASAMTAPMAPPAAKAADAKAAQAVDKTAARPAAKTAPRTAAKARAKTAGTAKSAAKAGGKAGKAAAPRKGKPARGASAADLS